MDELFVVTVRDRPDEIIEVTENLADVSLLLIPSVANELEVALYKKEKVYTPEQVQSMIEVATNDR